MSPPTRSLRLIARHIREQRISRTTLIVTAYLVANILGRASVAFFGLAFNLKDEKGITYPILATNWASALWTRNIDPSPDGPDIPKNHEIVEGKDTTPLDSVLQQQTKTNLFKRFLEFGLERIAGAHPDPWTRLGLWQSQGL